MKLAFTKREVGTRNSNKYRKEGNIPVVCYGSGEDTQHFAVNTKELNTLLKQDVSVIESEGDLKNKKLLLHQIERHPIDDSVIHIDFLFVDAKKKVEHEVPLVFVGEAPATKSQGGFVEHARSSVVVSAIPSDIPAKIEVDVSKLETVGSHLSVADISLPENVTMITSTDDIVVSIIAQKEEEEDTPTDEAIDFDSIEVKQKGKAETEESTEE